MSSKRELFEQQYAEKYFEKQLDCGHKPTDPKDSLYENGSAFVTGYATTPDGKQLCYECAANELRKDMISSGKSFLYMSSKGTTVTTWVGQEIAKIVITNKSKGNFGDDRFYFRFRFNGDVWSGMGRPSMYCRVRRTKYKALLDR
jgi:hypothetical protein